jgi:conjugal transfer pilus assembly protein TraA
MKHFVKERVASIKNVLATARDKGILRAVFTLAFFVLLPIAANAAGGGGTSGGTEFQQLYSMLTGWVTGVPGIMAAIILLVMGIYLSFFGQKSIMYFFGTALGAAAIFLLPNIATGIATATW